MTVSTVLPRIAQLQAGISGVVRAYSELPEILNRADCPAFITFTDEAQYDWQVLGADLDQETRIYTMRLYVQPVSNGYPGEGELAARPFFDRVRAQFAAYPRLNLLDGVMRAYLMGDSGVKTFEYTPGNPFWCIQWKLGVVEYVPRVYAPGE